MAVPAKEDLDATPWSFELNSKATCLWSGANASEEIRRGCMIRRPAIIRAAARVALCKCPPGGPPGTLRNHLWLVEITVKPDKSTFPIWTPGAKHGMVPKPRPRPSIKLPCCEVTGHLSKIEHRRIRHPESVKHYCIDKTRKVARDGCIIRIS